MPGYELETDHNVYILGAGFSADAGMPLVRGFMPRLREAADWLKEQGRTTELKAVQDVLEFRKTAASAAYRAQIDVENIEELFSLASAVHGLGLVSAMVRAISATLEHRSQVTPSRHQFAWAFRERIPSDVDVRWEPLTGLERQNISEECDAYHIPLYEYYVGALTGLQGRDHVGRNTFITFNYDTVLEQALHACGSVVDYGVPAGKLAIDPHAAMCRTAGHTSATQVLKLHGSVNWAYQGKRGSRPTAYQDYAAVTAAGLEPLLVPPTWQKMTHTVLSRVWETALEALTSATRVIVIGFSLPPTDVHFKYLIAGGLRDNISLREIWFIDPAVEGLSERIEQVLRPGLRDIGVLRECSLCLHHAIASAEFRSDIGRRQPEWLNTQ